METFKQEARKFVNAWLYDREGVKKVMSGKVSLDGLIYAMRVEAIACFGSQSSTCRSIIGKTIHISKSFESYCNKNVDAL